MRENIPAESNSLYHYGVLGMRWGVRKDKYRSGVRSKANSSKILSRGKLRTSKAQMSKTRPEEISSKSRRKSRKERSREAKAAVEKEAKTSRQRKERIESIIKSGSATSIYQNRESMTTKQLQDALLRLNTEKTIKKMMREENPTTLDKIQRYADTAKRVGDMAKNGYEAYENIQKLSSVMEKRKKSKE